MDRGGWPYTQINVIASLIRQPANLETGKRKTKAVRCPWGPHIFSSPPLSFLWRWWAACLLCLRGHLKEHPLEEIWGDCRVRPLSRVDIAVEPEPQGPNTSTRWFVLHSCPSAQLNTTCGFRIRTSTTTGAQITIKGRVKVFSSFIAIFFSTKNSILLLKIRTMPQS